MTRIYRVLRKQYGQAPFDGEGAFRYGGRWSSPGVRLAYASEHQSLAMLEYFVHLTPDDPPPDLVLAVAEVPDDVTRTEIKIGDLPLRWRETPSLPELAILGDEFIQRGEHLALLVPSAVSPTERNWLLNPAHPDFKRVVIPELERLEYDSRLLPGTHRGRKRGWK